jgi:hypothetical protein
MKFIVLQTTRTTKDGRLQKAWAIRDTTTGYDESYWPSKATAYQGLANFHDANMQHMQGDS